VVLISEPLTSFCVALEAQHNLWSTVPSRSHVFSHVSSIFLGINRETSSKSKVANLQLAISVDQQIARLQITMKDISRVDVFQSAENLVDERLEVGVGEGLAGTDNRSEIAFHKFYAEVSYCTNIAGIFIPS
jgi:hypothetical protein